MKPAPDTADARAPRPRRRRRSRIAIWLVLLGVGTGCVAIIYGVLDDRASAGSGLPDYSVYSDGPEGFAQAAALLRNLGWQPIAVTRPIQQTHHRGLLILALTSGPAAEFGLSPTLGDADVEGLLDWVRQGNTLLLCAQGNTRLHDKLGVVISEAVEADNTIYQAAVGAVGEYTDRMDHVGLERASTVSGRKAVPLWWMGNRPAAVLVQHGSGRVLIVPDPSILTHRGLLREDNAVFLYNIAALDSGEGLVYFDEYHRGIRSGAGFWSYLRYHGQQWIILQLSLVAGMALWAVGRRLGPAVPMSTTKRADGVDYASSVARIYEKADVRPVMGGIFARDFVNALTAHLRLRRNAQNREILAAWRQRHGDGQARELGPLLDAAEDLRVGRTGGAGHMVTLVQRLDAFLCEHEVR